MRHEPPLDRLTRITLELRYDAAASRLMLAAHRLADWLKYNPDWPLQPRGPDGRWIDAGGAVSAEAGETSLRPEALRVAATTQSFKYACKVLKIDPKKASLALHAAKSEIRNDDNCTFDLTTGDIVFNGEIIGNLRD